MEDDKQSTTKVPVMDVQQPSNEPISNPVFNSDGAPEVSSDKPNLSIPELPENTKKQTPKAAVLLIVVIALGLAAGAVYMYMKSNDKTAKSTTPATTQTAAKTPITATEVSNTATEVDKTVSSLDDTKDLSSSDLSDATLGL